MLNRLRFLDIPLDGDLDDDDSVDVMALFI
jgi:hypothetical protein